MTHNSEISLMRGSRLAVLGLHKAVRVYERGPGDSLIPVPPEAADRELIQDAIAFYSGADREYRGGGYAFVPSKAERVARYNP